VGALSGTVFSGDDVLASDHNDQLPLTIRKGTDTSRANTVAPAVDPTLKITLPAARFYIVVGRVVYNALAAADLKGGLYGPVNAFYEGGYEGQPSTAASGSGAVTTDQVGFGNGYVWGGTSADLGAQFIGYLYSGDGGDFGFTWSQAVTNATATIVRSASFFHLMPVF
jgi:hypothetical protein